jgi:hypothetical protein
MLEDRERARRHADQRERGQSREAPEGGHPDADSGAADLGDTSDDRLDVRRMQLLLGGERLLADAELLLDFLHGVDELIGRRGALVERDDDPSEVADGLDPPHRVMLGELLLQALGETVDLIQVDATDLDVRVALRRPHPAGPPSAQTEYATDGGQANPRAAPRRLLSAILMRRLPSLILPTALNPEAHGLWKANQIPSLRALEVVTPDRAPAE